MKSSITYTQPGFKQFMATLSAMVKKQLVVLSRYPVEFITSFAQMFFIVAIFSLAGLTFSPTGSSSEQISGIVVYGFVLFLFVGDTLWTIGYNIRQEQVQGTLEQLYLSPSSKFASLVSRVVHLVIWTGFLCITSIFVMKMLLGSLPAHNLGLGILLLIFNLLGTFGLGFAFAALTLKIKESANTLANLFQFMFIIFGASFFPFQALPKSMMAISKLLPPAIGADIFRSTLMGYPPGFPELYSIETEIWITVAYGVLMPFLGYYFYKRAEHTARKDGTLTAY